MLNLCECKHLLSQPVFHLTHHGIYNIIFWSKILYIEMWRCFVNSLQKFFFLKGFMIYLETEIQNSPNVLMARILNVLF